MNKPKIIFCIPCYRTVPEIFFLSFTAAMEKILKEDKYDAHFLCVSGQPIDRVRNVLVKHAMTLDPDYIFFLDSDMVFNQVMLDCLMEMNQDIVSALCFERLKPHAPALKKGDEPYWDFNMGDIIEAERVGMACALIKAKVFKETTYPWFKNEWKIKDDGEEYLLMEDLYFSDKVRSAGFKIFVNTGITCDHFGTEVGIDNFLYYKNLRDTERGTE